MTDRAIDNAPGGTQHLLPLITEQRRLPTKVNLLHAAF